MNESILESVKHALGIMPEYDHFDSDIMMYINTVFNALTQIGVGPSTGYAIEDSENTWDEFLDNSLSLNLVRTYMYMKVRMMFDPPASSSAAEAMKTNISELEWRISVTVDPGESEETSASD